jgi:hypothetical protein
MNRLPLIIGVGALLLFAFASTAEAGNIWQWTHQASGSGTANVFDGGPVEEDSRATTGLDDPSMTFGAFDRTQPGSLGARARVLGESRILGASDYSFGVQIGYSVGYFPSSFAGGDDPGGEAEGSLSSVIEFVAPVDDPAWSYLMNLRQDPTNAFTGSTDIMLENLTRFTVFQIPSEDTSAGFRQFDFDVSEGDLIRLTTEMSGSGGMGPGTGRFYDVNFQLEVLVPEPGTLSLLLISVALVRPRRRGRASTAPIRPTAPVIGGVA